MRDVNAAVSILTDQHIMEDSLLGQKQMTSSYNTFAGECVSPQLRTAMLNILNEEHTIQSDLFSDMQQRGWYQVEQAPPQKVTQTKQKYQSMS